jgi:signal transduction histidine kinase
MTRAVIGRLSAWATGAGNAWLGTLALALVMFVAAEAIARGYEARLLDDVRRRLGAGHESVAAQLDYERTRLINAAEVAGVRLGVTVQGMAPEDALRQVAAARSSLRVGLIAVVDGAGRTVASDPASNLPFGTFFEARQGQQGRASVNLVERTGGLALQAGGPIRDSAQPSGSAVIVAQSLEDALLNTLLRVNAVELAIMQNNRVVAASRGVRRSMLAAGDTLVDPELVVGGESARFGKLGAEQFWLSTRSMQTGDRREIGTLVVATPAETVAEPVRQARAIGFAAAIIAALVGGWILSRSASRQRARLAETRNLAISRLNAVLASLSEGVIIADEHRRVTLVNPSARALLNIPTDGDDDALAALDRVEATSQRVIRGYSAPVLDEVGQSLGTVTVLRDATREQEVDRLKSEFLAVVSHDLQTPLTAIKGALELVLDDDTGQLSRVQRRFLDTIERNTERLVALVSDLLDLSRLEAGGVELNARPLDTRAVVTDTVAALGGLFRSRDVTLDVRIEPDMPPIAGDRRRVEQVLTNLLSNAAAHTPPGGRVAVEASANNGHVVLSVSDSGPGIPDEERARVFEKFYRGPNALQRGDPGSGLGLAIVRSLVELHGGSARVEAGTAEMPGARFVVELPTARGDE